MEEEIERVCWYCHNKQYSGKPCPHHENCWGCKHNTADGHSIECLEEVE